MSTKTGFPYNKRIRITGDIATDEPSFTLTCYYVIPWIGD
jgi:hypothetical protein